MSATKTPRFRQKEKVNFSITEILCFTPIIIKYYIYCIETYETKVPVFTKNRSQIERCFPSNSSSRCKWPSFIVENLSIKIMSVHLSHHHANNNLSLKFSLCVIARK